VVAAGRTAATPGAEEGRGGLDSRLGGGGGREGVRVAVLWDAGEG